MKEIRKAIVVVIAAWFVASLVSAQDRYMWTGVRIHDGKREGKAVSAMNEAELREAKRSDPAEALAKELAEIRLLADVDRKTEEASKRLEDLRIRASWELDYPGRLDVLVEVAKTRSALFARLGLEEEAANAVTRLLPDEAAKRAAPTYELVPASAKLIEEEQRGVKDPRLLRSATGSAPASSPPRDGIEQAVVDALQFGKLQVAIDIGPRAAPALEKFALSHPDELREANTDALTALFELAPARGAKFALENYDRGGFFWHKRSLRSLMAQGSRVAEPIWTPVIRRMLDDPELRQDALVLLNPLAAQNVVRPEIQDAIARALDTSDGDFAFQVTHQLSSFAGRESIQPILEQLLESPIPDIRHFAGGMMQSYTSSPAMLRCVDHQDPEMRKLLASFLTKYPNHNPSQRNVVIDARAREVLGKLATDADAGVRAQAAEAIADIQEPFTPEVYKTLARDGDEKVLVEFDRMLQYVLARHAQEPWSLAALAERRTNPARPLWADWRKEELGDLLMPFLQTKDGARTIVGWALEDADGTLFSAAIAKLPVEMPDAAAQAGRLDAWMSGENGGLQALDDKMLELVYRRAFVTEGNELFPRIHAALCNRSWSKPRSAAMVPIVQDGTASRELRAYAARVGSPDANVDAAAIASFLLDGCWTKAAPTRSEANNLAEIGRGLQSLGRSAVFHRILESKDAVDGVAVPLILGSMDAGGDPSLVRPILDRWLTAFLSEGSNEQPGLDRVLRWTIQRIPAEHDDKASNDLLRALDNGRLRSGVIETMGRLRWPEFQDPLGERARNGDVGAVNALGGYMDDRTVECLLYAIGRSSNEEFRKTCLAQLDSIRKYQDEKARWATRKNGLQARDEAIAQLVPMLSDGDEKVRVQAILSLATLDAVEQLPKIVQFLKDKSPAVRQAAQQALDKLNAAEAKKP